MCGRTRRNCFHVACRPVAVVEGPPGGSGVGRTPLGSPPGAAAGENARVCTCALVCRFETNRTLCLHAAPRAGRSRQRIRTAEAGFGHSQDLLLLTPPVGE